MQRPKIEICETTVSQDALGSTVRLRICDAMQPPESVETYPLIELSVRLPAYEVPALAQIQREALAAAQEILSKLLQDLATDLTSNRYQLRPDRKK